MTWVRGVSSRSGRRVRQRARSRPAAAGSDHRGALRPRAQPPSMTPLVATYRLQLGPTLTLDDARGLVPYLRDLGVSHLYLSPVMQARAGSTHGYDVVDPTRVSDALGGEAALRALAAEGPARRRHRAQLHGASDENPFWRDGRCGRALRPRPAGCHRRFFDIDDLLRCGSRTGSVRAPTPSCRRWWRRRRRRCGSTTSTASPTRAGT